MLGWSFVQPLLPLFVQSLGNFNTNQAAFWTGLVQGAGGLAMFFSAPFWGLLSDRTGRKPMMLRAQFILAFTLIAMAFSPNIYFLIGVRLFQGLMGGTVAVASALVATATPRDKIPFSMGVFMVAVYLGTTLGPLIGGASASAFGFLATFCLGAIMYVLSGLAVLFYVKEDFVRPAPGQETSLKQMLRLAVSPKMLPLLVVIMAVNMGPQMVAPVIPLIIQGLSGTKSAAVDAGLAFALIGLATTASSYVAARLGKRISLTRLLFFCCLGTGLLYLPPVWAGTTVLLVIAVGFTGLFTGGLLIASNSLISLSVPVTQLGIAYGIAQSANSLGAGLGPIIGGTLAPVIGLRYVFAVAAGLFLAVGLAVSRRKTQK